MFQWVLFTAFLRTLANWKQIKFQIQNRFQFNWHSDLSVHVGELQNKVRDNFNICSYQFTSKPVWKTENVDKKKDKSNLRLFFSLSSNLPWKWSRANKTFCRKIPGICSSLRFFYTHSYIFEALPPDPFTKTELQPIYSSLKRRARNGSINKKDPDTSAKYCQEKNAAKSFSCSK